MADVEARIRAELAMAEQAANPGRARVCARRAAGLAIRAWYQRAQPGWGGDALHQLVRLRDDAAVPAAVRQAAERLTTRVNFEHRLPFDDDPVEDARQIIAFTQSD